MPVTTFTVSAIDTGTDIFTATGHNQAAGTPAFISAGTTLPAGLTADAAPLNKTSILYYIASTNLTADAFSLVTAKDGSGTPVNITSAGAGTILLQLSEGLECQQSDWVQASGSVEISNVPLAVLVTLSNLVSGSRVRVSLDSDGRTLSLGTAAGDTYSFTTKAFGLVNVDVRNASGSPKYLPYKAQGIVGANGMNMFVSQILDPVA